MSEKIVDEYKKNSSAVTSHSKYGTISRDAKKDDFNHKTEKVNPEIAFLEPMVQTDETNDEEYVVPDPYLDEVIIHEERLIQEVQTNEEDGGLIYVPVEEKHW